MKKNRDLKKYQKLLLSICFDVFLRIVERKWLCKSKFTKNWHFFKKPKPGYVLFNYEFELILNLVGGNFPTHLTYWLIYPPDFGVEFFEHFLTAILHSDFFPYSILTYGSLFYLDFWVPFLFGPFSTWTFLSLFYLDFYFPFSTWTFISLSYLDFYFPLLFKLVFPFLTFPACF